LPNAGNFVQFAWIGGGTFWANALRVKEVRAVDDMMVRNYKEAKSNLIFPSGINRVITEPEEVALAKLNTAGALFAD
jgi:hypothetical protein